MRCLLIDVGSTFIKYCVYDNCADSISLEDKKPFPEPSFQDEKHFRVSADKITDVIKEIMDIGAQNGCMAAFFSVQMHGYLLQKADGAVSEYVSWRDHSGDVSRPEFKSVDFHAFGTALKDNLSITKMRPEDKGSTFFTLGSYLSYILTGENATHISDACPSGFFFADTGKVNVFGDGFTMPKVYKTVAPIGKYKGICVYAPVGDHQVSFLGCGAEEDGYLVNIGTATQISCLAPYDFPNGNYEKRPYFYDSVRLYTVSGLVGGESVYKKEKTELLQEQILSALDSLPPKDMVYLGGGGSHYLEESVIEKIKEHGKKVQFCEKNIGLEGLKSMANQDVMKVGFMHSEIPFVNLPIIAKNTGLDFVILDNEHGAFDFSVMEGIITTANLIHQPMIVRIGNSTREYVTKLADFGVHGFLLPMTNTANDIQALVNYAKYAPIGNRGVSTTRAHTLYNPPALLEYIQTANEKMKIYAQIETRSGVEHLEEILSVVGVEGIFIGPNDMSMDYNCVGDTEKICTIIEKIGAICRKFGKPFGIITGDKKLIQCAKDCGATMFSIGSELNMLINGCKKIKETI